MNKQSNLFENYLDHFLTHFIGIQAGASTNLNLAGVGDNGTLNETVGIRFFSTTNGLVRL